MTSRLALALEIAPSVERRGEFIAAMLAAPSLKDLPPWAIEAVVDYETQRATREAGTYIRDEHGQFSSEPGGAGDGEVDTSHFQKDQWTSIPMMERRDKFAALPEKTRNTLADAPHTVQSQIDARLKGVPDRPEGTDAKQLAGDRTEQILAAGLIVPEAAAVISRQAENFASILAEAGVDPALAAKMTQDMVDAVAAQEIESMGRVLGDHGARHLEGNSRIGMDILDAVPGADSPEQMALILLAGAYHDTGYLTPPGQVFLDSDHPHWGQEHFDEHLRADCEAAFGKDFADRLSNLIDTHDSTKIDWDKDPEVSAFRVADNLALFQSEKLPSMCQYVPDNVGVLVNLGRGKIDLEEARSQMGANVDRQKGLSDPVRERLHAAVNEVNELLPKFTVGMVGARLGKISWEDDHLHVDMIRTPSNDALQKVLDMGQKQFEKFAKTYGIDPKEFSSTSEAQFTEDGKVVLSATIVPSTQRMVAMLRAAGVYVRDEHGSFATADGGSEGTNPFPVSPTGRVIGGTLDLRKSTAFEKASQGTDYATFTTPSTGDRVLKDLAHDQGFDGQPTVVSKEEFDRRVVDAGDLVLWRGDSRSDHAQQYLTGDFYAGRGVYGNGTYAQWGGGINQSTYERTSDPSDVAAAFASPGGAVIRLALKDDARIISRDDASQRMAAEYRAVSQPILDEARALRAEGIKAGDESKFFAATDAERDLEKFNLIAYNDVGRWATSQGYDAIKTPAGSMVILNRTAVIADETIYPVAFDSGLNYSVVVRFAESAQDLFATMPAGPARAVEAWRDQHRTRYLSDAVFRGLVDVADALAARFGSEDPGPEIEVSDRASRGLGQYIRDRLGQFSTTEESEPGGFPTTEAASKWIETQLPGAHVSIAGMAVEGANALTKAVARVLPESPFLKGRLIDIAMAPFPNADLYAQTRHVGDNEHYGIFLNRDWWKAGEEAGTLAALKANADSGFFVKGSGGFEPVLIHEMGHVTDNILHPATEELKNEWLASRPTADSSRYATFGPEERFAEAFASHFVTVGTDTGQDAKDVGRFLELVAVANEGKAKVPVVPSTLTAAARAVEYIRDEHGSFAKAAEVPEQADREALVREYADWASTLSNAEHSAVRGYLWNAMKLNSGIREGKGQEADRNISMKALDAALERSRLPHDMALLRCAPASAIPDGVVGKVISDRAYVSTAIDSGWFQTFVDLDHGEGPPMQLIISAHAGQPGAAIEAGTWEYERRFSDSTLEDADIAGELTLPRDAQFRVISDRVEKAPITDPSMDPYIRTVRLDYLGVGPHA